MKPVTSVVVEDLQERVTAKHPTHFEKNQGEAETELLLRAKLELYHRGIEVLAQYDGDEPGTIVFLIGTLPEYSCS